jgi:hypothetical protein
VRDRAQQRRLHGLALSQRFDVGPLGQQLLALDRESEQLRDRLDRGARCRRAERDEHAARLFGRDRDIEVARAVRWKFERLPVNPDAPDAISHRFARLPGVRPQPALFAVVLKQRHGTLTRSRRHESIRRGPRECFGARRRDEELHAQVV